MIPHDTSATMIPHDTSATMIPHDTSATMIPHDTSATMIPLLLLVLIDAFKHNSPLSKSHYYGPMFTFGRNHQTWHK